MLRLIAVTYEDGYALVRENNNSLYFVRPRYGIHDRRAVPEDLAELAISKYGFTPTYAVFNDWNSLIIFLNSKKASGNTLDARTKRLLIQNRVPLVILLKYLIDIEVKLIAANKFEAAMKQLERLLNRPLIKNDEFLSGMCLSLKAYCIRKRESGSLKAKTHPVELT